MSGHNKWSTIKHKKAKTDAVRGKIFTKIIREIMIAAKLGGADPDGNANLRLAIQKAKESNMPNENIKRAISRGAGGGDDANLDELTYEAYAPFGVGLLIECLTDNKVRTVSNIKSYLNKANGSLATTGAVSFNFDKKGLIVFEPGADEDKIMEIALEAGAEDVQKKEDESIEVVCEITEFEGLRNAILAANLKYESAEITQIAKNLVTLNEDQAGKILKLVDRIEEDDDVKAVYGNFDIPDDVYNKIEGN